MCKVSDWCVLFNLKKYKLLTYDLLRFVSQVLWHAWWHARLRAWVIDDIMISVTKQMEAAEANVCCGGLQNDNEELWVIHRAIAVAFRMVHDACAAFITKNWVATQLKRSAHFIFRETGTAVHMIFRQNFVVPGHWFFPKKVVILWVRALTVREIAFGCCCCCCWQPHGLLICNSWFLKFKQHTSVWNFAQLCNFV